MSRNQDPKKPSGDSEFWREDRPAVVDGFSNNPRARLLSRNKWNNLEILLHKQYSSRASLGSEVCCPPFSPPPHLETGPKVWKSTWHSGAGGKDGHRMTTTGTRNTKKINKGKTDT